MAGNLAAVRCGMMWMSLVALVAVAGSSEAQCNGNLDLVPVSPPANIVRFVRRVHVVANNATDSTFKILFDNMRLQPFAPTANGPTPYVLFATLYSVLWSHSGPVCSSAPSGSTPLYGQAAVSPNIQDYPNYQVTGSGQVGVRTVDTTLLPRAEYQVDGLPGLWWRGADMQMNLNGKYLVVDVKRRGRRRSTSGWQCNGTLPKGRYRQWDIAVSVWIPGAGTKLASGRTGFIAPDAYAQYLGPFDFSTEFFTSSPGLFKIYLDELQVAVDGAPTLRPLCTWRVAGQCGSTNEYGVKLGPGNVIEISNDGPANGGPGGFFAPGTTFTLPGCG
jgi:hypothetical protein